MKSRWHILLLSFVLILSQFLLAQQPALASANNAAVADAEQDAFPVIWSLPITLTQTVDQLIDGCVRLAFDVSQWSQNLTGTLTYSTNGKLSYRSTPRDHLRMVAVDGTKVDFWITDFQGTTTGTPDDFLGNNYQLSCRAQHAMTGDLTVTVEQSSDGLLNRTRHADVTGSLIYEGQEYEVDAQSTSDIYFESSFGGSEYRNQTQLTGTIRDAKLDLTLAESFSFQQITLDNESAAASQRLSNSQWRVAGKRYALQDGFLNQSFKDGKPSRIETEWRAGGSILRNNRQWASLLGQQVGDFFEVRTTAQGSSTLLIAIPLTETALNSAPANQAQQEQQSASQRSLTVQSILKADAAERTRIATEFYQLIGLDQESAQLFVLGTGVSDEMMVVLVLAVSRFYNIDHQYKNAQSLLELTRNELDEINLPNSDRKKYKISLSNELGKTYYYLGNTDSAVEHLNYALDGYRVARDNEGQAVALANLALIYEERAEYEAALAADLEAIGLQEKVATDASTANTLHNQLTLFRSPLNLGTLYSNIGSFYHTLGENSQAEAAYNKALNINQDAGDRSGEATTLHNLGRLYADLGEGDKAIETLNAALNIVQETTDNPLKIAHMLNALGDAYAAQNEYDKALEQYTQALERFQQLNYRPGSAFVLNSMGVIHLQRKEYAEAEPLLREASSSFESLGYRTEQSTVLSNLGFIYEQQGDNSQALDLYRNAIALIESIQGQLRVSEVKSAFLSHQSGVYAQLIHLLWQEGNQQEAFDYAERARARALLDQLGNVQAAIDWQADQPLVKQAETVRHQLINLQNALATEQTKALDQQSQPRIDELGTQLELARTDYEKLLTRLKLTSPEYESLVQVDTLPLAVLQKEILDADTTLIEYFVLSDRTLAWVIDKQGFHTVNLTITRTDLLNKVEYFRNTIANKDFDVDTATELYQLLIEPLKPYIKHTNLLIVPHNLLHYLPFAALWNKQTSHYLIEDVAITYAPSASALKFILQHRNTNQNRILALGNADGSLPQAEKELTAVAKLYNSTPLLGKQATESEIYKQAHQLDLLHLSAHGIYDPYRALYTRIELTADKTNDGNLEVHEIFGLDLKNTNLVVLSACETALGAQSNGDELIGLTRAFLYAGSPAVVTTLWSINDEASGVLMESFYHHLQDGMSNAQALRIAQLEILAQDKWNSPYYWAAFALTGDYLGNNKK